ncbi:DUF927 domain-containing protein [Belnapia sp. T18]|uniref:DUF927 domain-containing protein n=1 Tax=Belnapia arida TaxID=2804533 RepID=A0ABS1UB58_9PROT|nr:DUF927 domain-containing protein [Belnapia arida]MBL6080917.1 DUF927 domain-containing protein [Belnapia arida]
MNKNDDHNQAMSMEEIIAAEGGAFSDERDLAVPMTGCDRLPHGFMMTARGLRFRPEGAEHAAIVTLDPFDVRGRIADADGTNPGTAIGWTDNLGRRLETIVSDTLLHSSGGALPAELARRGLRCAVNSEKHLRFFFSALDCGTQIERCERPGWQMGGVYVLPTGEVFGAPAGSHHLATRSPDRCCQAGDLDAWKETVAAPAVGNSRLAYGICQSLTGPLLEAAQEAFVASHLQGGSSTGKSTVLEAAASVWGRPDARDAVRSWRSTDNALESVAALANDGLLALDELGQAPPETVAASLYMLANGAGKARATTDGSARAVRSWRTSLFSTGERSPEDIIRTAGRSRDNPAGLDVRLAVISADAGKGMGAFECLHGHPSPRAFADALRAAAARHYGTAGRAWLAALVRERDPTGKFDAAVRQKAAEVAARMTPAGADGQVARVVGKMALVAVAGELAIAFGVLPWPAGTAEQAVAECCRAWLARRGSTRAREELDVLRAVQSFVAAHGQARFEDVDGTTEYEPVVRDRAGWKTPSHFLFTAPAFAEAVRPAGKKDAAKVLRKEGFMAEAGSTREYVRDQQRARVYAVNRDILGWSEDAGEG